MGLDLGWSGAELPMTHCVFIVNWPRYSADVGGFWMITLQEDLGWIGGGLGWIGVDWGGLVLALVSLRYRNRHIFVF